MKCFNESVNHFENFQPSFESSQARNDPSQYNLQFFNDHVQQLQHFEKVIGDRIRST